MKKIMLIGSGGSGKSTLARQLGQRLGIRVHHLDSLSKLGENTSTSKRSESGR
ncbi:adenylate kinase family enzyme [Exiguobacterium sp. PvP048]